MIQLMQGDCLKLMKQIPDGSIDLVLTDPPYGTTACKWDSIIPLEPMWAELKRVVKPNAAIVMTASQPFTTYLISSNLKKFRYCWIWEKTYTTGFMNANKMPLKNIEDICVFYKKTPTYNPQGVLEVSKKQTRKKDKGTTIYSDMGLKNGEYIQKFSNYPRQVLTFGKIKSPLHPTQKPVPLMEYMIKTYSNQGETVLDFTMGSGTTGVACKNTGRNFIGIELDEHYFNIAKQRIEAAA